ncbi:Por secretion system C-terminal sorting domain-containing protein [Dyadobacter sp. SG02]|uniref:T9SS type A sorting domain-containing protein n=1 Tax=Dyadobacter sp. SG02 TaxID=1855291 RepID=UPI0008CB3396|nr:T9SS type A sorting domain-containing protein [Dyadobacter sp. SG02]SEJ37986.1 Por secretion system C-terminal sorting domain-containing protein [Dyadobacter sp. SG02]
MGKYFINVLLVVAAGLWAMPRAVAQDVSINIIAQQTGINDDLWPLDATDCAILVTVCNNDGGTRTLPAYKIRPGISVPAASVSINGVQNGLPAGWTILSNSGSEIRLSNGTDALPAGECREFALSITPLAQTISSETVNSVIEFASGTAPGTAIGPSTVSDMSPNNTSATGVTITGAMPVTLVAFDARDEGGTVNLAWSTAEEVNSDHFEIQHSVDGRRWKAIGSVESGHKSVTTLHYTFAHITPSDGNNYYRLKMVDYDGSFAFSAIRSVLTDMGISLLFPNPVSTELYIHEDKVAPVSSLSIMNIDGRVLFEIKQVSKPAVHVGQLANGTYLLRIKRHDGTEQTGKFVVAK